MYAERAYFDGDHCQHCADWCDYLRLRRIRKKALDAVRSRA